MNHAERRSYRNPPGCERFSEDRRSAKPDRPDAFTPVSCVPWVSFTAVGHDTPGPRQMYFPIIVFGRYHEVHDRWMLPFSIMVNHAVADGYHTSMLIHDIQEQCSHCKKWLKK